MEQEANEAPLHPPLPTASSEAPGEWAAHVWSATIVTVISMGYLLTLAFHGWSPADDGMLAHCAERILQGELPHRDFDDAYTGGLSMMHAAAFKLWGIRLSSLRIALLLFSPPFILAIYTLSARATKPAMAAAVTLLAVVWGLPNYFASMPSWYNLIFATWGACALVRFGITDRKRWLFIAGLCGGLSIAVKVIGLFYVAAVLLYCIDRERRARAVADSHRATPAAKTRGPGYFFLLAAALGLFVAALAFLIRHNLEPMDCLLFVAPGAILAAYLLWAEWESPRGPVVARVVELTKLIVPFLLGVLVPAVAFAFPYALSGSLTQLYVGVFVMPQSRLAMLHFGVPELETALTALPYAAILLVPVFFRIKGQRWLALPLGIGLLSWVAMCGANDGAYRMAWNTLRPLVPAVVGAGCLLLARRDRDNGISAQRGGEMFLLLALVAMLSLVQYPYAPTIYFVFVAPLVILAVVFIVASQSRPPLALHGCVGLFYFLFAAVWLNHAYLPNANRQFLYVEQNTLLDWDRGGIYVSELDAHVYRNVRREVQAHSAPGSAILAAPYCPEIYFLADRRNATPMLYDHLYLPHERIDMSLRAIEENEISTVVISRGPHYSFRVDFQLAEAIARTFPNQQQIDWFFVLWRDSANRSSAPNIPTTPTQ